MGRRNGVIAAIAAIALLSGCTNAPPPPLVNTPIASTTPSRSVNPGEAVIGVDSVAGGFNPHKPGDQSAVTTALSTLLLPSVFRPAPDGTPQLDRTLMVSAEVTKAEPYTVSYQLRPDASWSDGAPIAAEDFVYLSEQLRGAAGGIGAAGYRLISNFAARDGGKIVEVTFAKPYPGWRSLFAGLLPAHLLKDAPGGWTNALADSFPASGGPFLVKTMDRDRGEIALERNDRYWEQPSALDRIILRRSDQSAIVDALRSGHDQLALAGVDATGASLIGALGPTVAAHPVARPTVVTLLLRPDGPDLADPRVRQAVAALLDRQPLITIGTGGGPAAKLRADAQVLPPTAPGYAATLAAQSPPARPDPGLAQQLLTQAGYVSTGGTWTRAGRPLTVVIAAPAERESYQRIAAEVQRQLAAAGIQVRTETPEAEDLFARLAARPSADTQNDNAINLIVAPQPAGGDPATVLATNFGCAAKTEQTDATDPANPAGFCDPTLQPNIDAALTGAVSLSDALSSVEPALWRQWVSIPLYQEADMLVIRPEMSGVAAGPPLAGPFTGAAGWRRTAG